MSIKKKYNFLPSPFTIAVLLTIVTIIIALVFGEKSNQGNHFINILTFWENGLWNSSLLEFAIQMMLMLVLGHTLALSKPVKRFVHKIAKFCTNTEIAASIVTFFSLLVSLFNWGLGLVFGAIFVRTIGEYCEKNNININYPLVGAAGYSGMMIWHCGISGSAPIKIAEKNHFLAEEMGVISMSETIFSTMNITVILTLLVILPIMMYRLGKTKNINKKYTQIKKVHDDKLDDKNTEGLNHSILLATFFGSLICFYAFYKGFILPESFSLQIITPNYINIILLGLAILMHKNFYNFLQAVNNAIVGASGILIQFPLYFGIMGIMKDTGMIQMMSDFFVNISDKNTFPILTFISSGIVNIFVPSGGGQWAIQGPIIIEAASQLEISFPKAVMALAYGDQITNMLQPFWALPLLGITGLKAKEIFPYCLYILVAGSVVYISALLIF